MKRKINLLDLASKGRNGDTEIRRVNGRLSHVNKIEANAIDNYGKAGEAWTQSVGSGTTNPQTGLLEYLPKWLTPPRSVRNFAKNVADYSLTGPLGPDWWFGDDSWIRSTGFNTTWHPSSGQLGIFGRTGGARDAQKEKAKTDAAKAAFDAYRDKYSEEDIAALQTTTKLDDKGSLVEGVPGSENTRYQDFLLEAGFSDLSLDELEGKITAYEGSDWHDRVKALELESENIRGKGMTTADKYSHGLLSYAKGLEAEERKRGFEEIGDYSADLKLETSEDELASLYKGFQSEQEKANIDMAGARRDYSHQFWADMFELSQDTYS